MDFQRGEVAMLHQSVKQLNTHPLACVVPLRSCEEEEKESMKSLGIWT
jgi:hypothetical protein